MQKHDVINGVPVMSWCPGAEDGATRQIVDAAKHPAVFKHVAMMPDAHQGYGVPIGSVVALSQAISPNMVGVDIGCGMCATQTSLTDIAKEDLNYLRYKISKRVPVGMSTRGEIVDHGFPIDECFDFLSQCSAKFSNTYKKKVEKSIGTLGGGNHFIEVQKGDDGKIWVMIHSGSRNLGYSIAEHFNNLAKKTNTQYRTERNDIAPDLAFLSTDTTDGKNYITAMNYALEYARENRKIMMDIVIEEMNLILSDEFKLKMNSCDCRLKTIDVHHNYASLENHFGKNVWVHRKGATSAKDGEFGIIPGSMGAKSYIVIGKGNIMSFSSCSHGAGRNFSRTAATLNLDIQEQNYIMSGIVFDGWSKIKRGNKKIRGKIDLGEAPGAYKSIDEVMKNQEDLVSTYTELTPLMVVKG